jgi:uncharacterized protein YhdP
VYDSWIAVKRQLAGPEPLSPRLRAVWQHSADVPVVLPTISWRRLPVAAGLAIAACVLIALTVTFWSPPRSQTEELVQTQPATGYDRSVRDIDTSAEFERLETSLQQLDIQIAALMPQTELLDARLQASDILNRYSKW